MDTKSKSNPKENKNFEENKISKGFILSILLIIVTAVLLNLYVTNVFKERDENGVFFTTGKAIYEFKHGYGGQRLDESIKTFNMLQMSRNKEEAEQQIKKGLEEKLALLKSENENRLKENQQEIAREFDSLKSRYNIAEEEDIHKIKEEYKGTVEKYDSGEYRSDDIANNYQRYIEFLRDYSWIEDSNKSRVQEINRQYNNDKINIENEAESFRKSLLESNTLKKLTDDSNLTGFYYKIESLDGAVEVTNNREINNLRNTAFYVEMEIKDIAENFNILDKGDNPLNISDNVYGRLAETIKMTKDNSLKNTKLTLVMNNESIANSYNVKGEKFILEAIYNLDYVVISFIVLLVIFICSMIKPYRGNSFIERAFSKCYIEIKVGTIICLALGLFYLIIGTMSNAAFFLAILIATSVVFLIGRNIRYYAELGFFHGFLRNFIAIDILYRIKNYIFSKGVTFKKEVATTLDNRKVSKSKSFKKEKNFKINDLNFEKLEINKIKNSTKNFKEFFEESSLNKKVLVGVVSYLSLLTITLIVFVEFISSYYYSFPLTLISSIIIIFIFSVFPYFISKKFFQQLKGIEEASEKIAKGEFNINLKESKNKELNEITKNLNNINKGFKSAVQGELTGEKMKAELITNVSHDLKTPLTSIINYVDLLQKDNLTELQQQEYLNILENKSKRLKVLVEDLHEATKASSGNLAINLEPCDIVQILNQSLNEFKEKIQHSNLIYKIEIPEEEIILNLDRTKMLRVFDNLIGNTLKYSMNKSRVYVKLKRENEKVKFKVQNISAYELNCEASELKERFKRGDASRHTEGSGLGLAIASTLLELQGGELEIKIDGDLFTVEIVV